jgi:hypothetical protein
VVLGLMCGVTGRGAWRQARLLGRNRSLLGFALRLAGQAKHWRASPVGQLSVGSSPGSAALYLFDFANGELVLLPP